MARKKVGLKIRPNSIEENESILRELLAQNKVDDRSPKDLKELFDNLNANNFPKDTKDDEKFAAFSNTDETAGTYGPIPGCPSGSWWGIRVDCSRQGAHKPFNLDIHHGPFGAISICTPQSTDSKDVDFGDYLTLTVREYSESNSEVESLNLNLRRCVPLRLVRSYSLSNKYSPKTGYRYDGLYVVVAHWIGESEDSKKHHKFALMRILNQDPPPWLQTMIKPLNHRIERVKHLPKRLSCTLRNRSPKLKSQSVSSTENDKYNCEKLNHKKSESPSVSQNGIAILTRQVFKKPNANSESTPPVSQSARTETPTKNSYMYKKLGQSKLQNTNISVRTDLYDSSHNVQQEAKKSAPMTFCRIYKPNKLSKPEVMEAETSNGEKTTALPADWSEVNNSILQRKNVEDKKIENAATNPKEGNEVQRSPSISHESIYRIGGCPISNETDEVDFARKDPKSLDHQDTDSPEKRKSTGNSTSSHSLNALKALTPDKILNLVVKEKRNPMAKLLIGNVIGLSIEESSVIQAYNALISKDNKESENVERQSDSRLKTSSNFKMISKRILRHNRNDENRKNYSKLAKRKQGCNDSGQKTGTNPKFNDDPGGAIGYSKSVKRPKVLEDSTMKKSPGSKKQRREIANLVINAKMGPIIRGPRNRRLRCQNHKRIGKEHDGFIGSSGYPRRRGILNKPAKRSELSKRSKRLNGRITKARKLQPGNINLNLARGKRSKTLEVTRNFKEIITRNSEVKKTTVNSTGDKLTGKSKMVDAMAQCSLLSEPSIMESCFQVNPEPEHSSDPHCNSDRLSVVKIEEIDLGEVKSEDDGEFSEEESIGSHECLNGFGSEEVLSSSRTYERVANRGLESIYNIYPLIHRESAFVPVNSSSSLKIARLRSIGFRPIQIVDDGNFTNNFSRICESRENTDSIRKEADEEYNKYANEETSDVGYMEDDLHYEDIENEDKSDVNKKKNVFLKRIIPAGDKYKDLLQQGSEESNERPWHGWKKVNSEKGVQWIGW